MTTETHDSAKVSRDGAVGIITMHHPDTRNAFGMKMKEALKHHFNALHHDKTCKAIVLAGSGLGFSAGGNLKEIQARTVPQALASIESGHQLIRMMVGGPKPIVASVEGFAHGAGLALAAACDYVIAAENAVFSCAFLRLGLVADNGTRWLLTQRVGPSKAKELLMLSRSFDGNEALRMGFANQVCPAGKALTAAIEVAHQYAKNAPLAIAYTKSSFADAGTSLEDCFQTELKQMPNVLASNYYREAVAAFLEKRTPVFTDD